MKVCAFCKFSATDKDRYREHSEQYGYNSVNDFAVKSMENQIVVDKLKEK